MIVIQVLQAYHPTETMLVDTIKIKVTNPLNLVIQKIANAVTYPRTKSHHVMGVLLGYKFDSWLMTNLMYLSKEETV